MPHTKDHTVPTSEKFNFDDTVAFVSGAAGGISRAPALAFAREEADVVMADIDEAGNEETADLHEETGSRALAVSCDLRESDGVQAVLGAAIEEFGRLDYACKMVASNQGNALVKHVVDFQRAASRACLSASSPGFL